MTNNREDFMLKMLEDQKSSIMKKQEELATCLFLTGEPSITNIQTARNILHDQVVKSLLSGEREK